MRPILSLLMHVLLALALCSGVAKAQHQSVAPVQLVWNVTEDVFPVTGLKATIPSFSGATIDMEARLPYYRLSLPGKISSFSLTNHQYAPFTSTEQQQFSGIDITTDPKVDVIAAMQNKQSVSIISILPIRRNPQTGQLEKLTRFNYNYIVNNSTTTQATQSSNAAFSTNSVLGSGNWYKLAITTTGIYKIDKATLQELGISTQNLDPRTIQLFGNGGGMLPQPNNVARPDDLQENLIMVAGEQDGRFDDGDHILFYGQGPHTWNYNQEEKRFTHNYNYYSDTTFYFLRIGYTTGKRIQNRAIATGATQTITNYNERIFHERDLLNAVHSGREWYGEDFSTFSPARDFNFDVTGIISGSTASLTAFLMASSAADSYYNIKANNQLLGTISIPTRGTHNYHPEGVNGLRIFTFTPQFTTNPTELKANITYNFPGDPTASGYLNYLELNFIRELKLYGSQSAFRSVSSLSQPVNNYLISGAPATARVWDITDPLRPLQQQTTSNGGLQFSATSDILREFIVFNDNTGLKPIAKGKVPNQNLHSLNLNGAIDHVIVTHPSLLQQANRLAAHRNNHSNLQSVVVTTTEVFNEFSSGAQDVTAIRDFMRMLYSRSSKPEGKVMYLLLFGDTSYDYKNRISLNTNLVPVYQSRQSLHPITSYSSEDYYGFLDDDEGEWAEDNLGDHLLDVGIGRLPVKNIQEAAVMVDKIISYESNGNYGKWRNQVTLVADDGDFNEHQDDAEALADYLEENAPNYNSNKLYVDLFRQEAVANGQRVPQLNEAINKAVEQGSLLVNYTGHGNEISWASEQILTLPQIKEWRNKDKLTFMLTATCEFGRYDDPARVSGAELAMLHNQGGAIGLLTTTRPVYSNGNRVLNRNFFKSAFTPANGSMPRLGDLVLQTKNNSITDNVSGSRGVNNRNFTLLSDPGMQLATPALKAQLTHINDREVTTDTLSALGKINLKGKITTPDGALATDFNGNLNIIVYEKQHTQQTFGDNSSIEKSIAVPVKLRQNVLYDGMATISNGLFKVSFVVPKDINYTYGTGKIMLYASSPTRDASGANTSVIVGGTSRNIATDNTAPTIDIYLEDESFVFGGNTRPNPKLLVKLYDENGINTAGQGIGHELTAILDGNEDAPVILNDYYSSEKDSYQYGRINYPLKALKPGPHSLRIKAWDTYNNAAEEYIEFFVSNDSEFSLEHVLNHPNPFSTKTTFHFDHNRAGEDLDIQIQIFTISGKLVKTLQTTIAAAPTHVAAITWNGKDEYNDLLARGVYVYKINVRSGQDGAKTTKFEKLVILN